MSGENRQRLEKVPVRVDGVPEVLREPASKLSREQVHRSKTRRESRRSQMRDGTANIESKASLSASKTSRFQCLSPSPLLISIIFSFLFQTTKAAPGSFRPHLSRKVGLMTRRTATKNTKFMSRTLVSQVQENYPHTRVKRMATATGPNAARFPPSSNRRTAVQARQNLGENRSEVLKPRIIKDSGTAKDKLPSLVLGALLLMFVSNQWSRALIYYINDFTPNLPIPPTEAKNLYANIDLDYDSSAYSWLASFGFTGTFAVASIFAGRVSDTYPRGLVLSLASLLWSAFLALGSLSQDFNHLFASRALMGIAQAVTTPASYTLLAELTPKDKIAFANSVFSLGIYLGGGLASLSIILDQQVGWRGSGLIVAMFGVLSSIIGAIIIRDPRYLPQEAGMPGEGTEVDAIKGTDSTAGQGQGNVKVRNAHVRGSNGEQRGTNISHISHKSDKTLDSAPAPLQMKSVVRSILESKPVVFILLASTVRFMAGFTIAAWKAPLFLELFPDQAINFGVSNALIIALAGSVSTLVGGILADTLAQEAKRGAWKIKSAQARLLVPVLGSLLAAPLWGLTVEAGDFKAASTALLLEYIVAECWFGPAQAALYAALPDPSMRASTQGVFSLLTAVSNVAPVAVGSLISDGGIAGLAADTPIQTALLWTVSPAYVISAGLFALAAIQLKTEDEPET